MIGVVGPPLPHGGEPGEFNATQRVALPLSFAVGSAIALTGLWAISSANRDHRYREEVALLSQQEELLRLAVKQARRERKLVARR